MTWQLLIAAQAAANLKPGLPPTPDPTADVSSEWDSSNLGVGLALSNFNRDAQNTGVNNSTALVRCKKPIYPSYGKVYWEVFVAALGAATNRVSIGFQSQDSSKRIAATSIGSAGGGMSIDDTSAFNTAVYRNGTTAKSGLTSSRGVGKVIMFCLDAATGAFWVGIDGAWQTGNYGASSPVTGVPFDYVEPGMAYYPTVSPKDNGDVLRLNSIPSEFAYSLPSGCRSLGSDMINFYYHELPVENTGFIDLTGWETLAGASTMASSTSVVIEAPTPSGGYDAAGNWKHIVYPNTSTGGVTFGTLYQDLLFDSRFNSLIDGNEIRIRTWAWVAQIFSNLSKAAQRGHLMFEFYDATNTLIGSRDISPGIQGTPNSPKHVEYDTSVPALTRKIRFLIEIPRPNGGPVRDPVQVWQAPRVALYRKVSLLNADHVSPLHVILGRSEGHLGIRHTGTHIILTP